MIEGTEKDPAQEKAKEKAKGPAKEPESPAGAHPGGEQAEGAVSEELAAEHPHLDRSEAKDSESGGEAVEEAADEEEADGEEAGSVAALQAQVAEHKDKLLRAMAEMENVRRRTRREKEDAAKYAITNFAREMLQVSDNLRRAVESVDAESRKTDQVLENLCVGVEMTEKIMLAAFEKVGIRPIEAEGARFDHNLHEAMFEVEAPELPAGEVVQVMRGGYMLHDRLLRPAQVGVSRGGPKPEAAADPSTAIAGKPGTASAYEKPAKDAGANLDEEL